MRNHRGLVNNDIESQRNQHDGMQRISGNFHRALHPEPVTWFEKRTAAEPGQIFNVTRSALAVDHRHPLHSEHKDEQTQKNDSTRSMRDLTRHKQIHRTGELYRFSMGNQDKHPLEPMVSRSNAFHSVCSHQVPQNEYKPMEFRRVAPSSPLRSNFARQASLSTFPSMEKQRSLPGNKKQMGPIIFLDIDGVVHSVQVTREEQLFRRDKMHLLRHLVQQSGASICLSSAWRLQPKTLQIVNQQLVRHGMDPVIDKTRDDGYAGKRSAEILYWVAAHEPKSWIAIDDLDLLTGEPRMLGHFLHTNSFVGLTAESCEQGLRMLRNSARPSHASE
eukprot:GEMP01026702.1.p1 GENE.GEMP01026702.1~~GEMP01026702.1.p1  ORF type:complete len:332 (+),score=52.87 GEMP01026702.1:160-1155(+)